MQSSVMDHKSFPSRGRALAEILAAFVIAAAVTLSVSPWVGQGVWGRIVTVVLIESLIGVLIWRGLVARGQGWTSLGLGLGGVSPGRILGTVGRSVGVFFVATLAFVIAGNLAAPLLDRIQTEAVDGGVINSLGVLAVSLLSVWITASFMEEVIFRGFLLNRLRELFSGNRWGVPVAVLIGALLFGAAHTHWGPVGIVQTTAMGLVLGAAYMRYRDNLWITILAHGYMDTLLLVSVYFSNAA